MHTYFDLLGTSFCNYVKGKSSIIASSQNMEPNYLLHYIVSSAEATEVSLALAKKGRDVDCVHCVLVILEDALVSHLVNDISGMVTIFPALC